MSTDAPEIIFRHEQQLAEHEQRLNQHEDVMARLTVTTDRLVDEIASVKDVLMRASITINKTIISAVLSGVGVLIVERFVT